MCEEKVEGQIYCQNQGHWVLSLLLDRTLNFNFPMCPGIGIWVTRGGGRGEGEEEVKYSYKKPVYATCPDANTLLQLIGKTFVTMTRFTSKVFTTPYFILQSLCYLLQTLLTPWWYRTFGTASIVPSLRRFTTLKGGNWRGARGAGRDGQASGQ